MTHNNTPPAGTALTPEQEERLNIVMGREAEGGGHLTDRRHLGDMPNFRPSVVPDCDLESEKKTVFAHGQWVG